MLGIDTMGLLGVLSWIYLEERGEGVVLPRWAVVVANVGVLTLWTAFFVIGFGDGMDRWQSGLLPSQSGWPAWFGYAFIGGGLMVATGIVGLTWRWLIPKGMLDAPGAERPFEAGAERNEEPSEGAGEEREAVSAGARE
jgi:hypothetical protein